MNDLLGTIIGLVLLVLALALITTVGWNLGVVGAVVALGGHAATINIFTAFGLNVIVGILALFFSNHVGALPNK